MNTLKKKALARVPRSKTKKYLAKLKQNYALRKDSVELIYALNKLYGLMKCKFDGGLS